MGSSWVTTATGLVFDYDLLLSGKPQAYPATMLDIAIPASRSARWMGVVSTTRAEHAVLTSQRCEEHALSRGYDPRVLGACGLLHDGMETYAVDLPRPLKRRSAMREYCEIEETGLAYLMRAFGIGDAWLHPEVRRIVDRADEEMLAVEIRDVVPPLPEGYSYDLRLDAPSHYKIVGWNSDVALDRFVQRWIELGIPTVGAA